MNSRPLARSLGKNASGSLVRVDELWTPRRLFAGGMVGGWYDPSDISTLWQDSARTTRVTATGDPVGCIEDKSGNGLHMLQATAAARPTYRSADTPATFGAELLTNGDFAADANWTKGTGWTIASGVATHASGSSGGLTQNTVVASSKTYRITYTISGMTAGTINPRFAGGTTTVDGIARTANGTYTEDLTNNASGNTSLSMIAAALFDGSIDNVSMVEVLTFVGYPNLLFDGVDDFLSVAYTPTTYPLTLAAAIYAGTTTIGGYVAVSQSDTAYKRLQTSTTLGQYPASDRNLANLASTPTAVPAGAAVVIGAFDTASFDTYVNALAAANTANTNAFGTPSNAFLGKGRPNGSYYASALHGAIILPRLLTASEYASVKNYLGSKNGLLL